MAPRGLTPWFGRSLAAPRRWPENPFDLLHRDVDCLLGDFMSGVDLSPWTGGERHGSLIPKMDVAESENAYEVTADLPGVDEKDVDVSITEGVLHIRGERSFGRFERAIALPDDVDSDKIAASFKQGVLRLNLPKSTKAKETAKKIEVKAARRTGTTAGKKDRKIALAAMNPPYLALNIALSPFGSPPR